MSPLWATMAVWVAAYGRFAGRSDRTRAAPIADRLAPSLAADARFADKPSPDPQPMTLAAVGPSVTLDLPPPSDLSLVSKPAATEVTADTVNTETTAVPPSREPDPIVTAALTDPSEMLQPETPPQPPRRAGHREPEPGIASREPGDINQNSQGSKGIGSVEILDECFVVEICVNRYLFALYQRAPKEDTVKVDEKRKVTVKRKGKLVTVTRTFTTRVDEDFGWKDPKAADRAGMSMTDYVIGGMDRDFKLKLFRMLSRGRAAGPVAGYHQRLPR